MLLVEILNFNNVQEACDFCSNFGLEVTSTTVKLMKGSLSNTQPPRVRFSNMTDLKLTINTADMINGRCLVTCAMIKSSTDAPLPKAFAPAAGGNNSEPSESSLDSQPVSNVLQLNERQSWFGKGRGRGRGRKTIQ